MRSVAKRQPHILHHWLWLLMGLFIALTSVFVSRITWLLTHASSQSHPYQTMVYNPIGKAHTHVARKPTVILGPLWVMEDAPKTKTVLESTPKIKLPAPPASIFNPVVVRTATVTTTPSMHLAAFFKASIEAAPKTIIPTYVPPAELPIPQAASTQAVATPMPAPVKIADMPPLSPRTVHFSANPRPPSTMPLQTRIALVNQHLQQGEYRPALALVDRGLQQYPQSNQLIKLKALILVGLQQPGAALTLLRDNEPNIKHDPDWYAFIAGLYQREGDHANAADYYQRVLAERPDRGNWWVGLAISQEALGQKQAALQSYQHAQEAAISPALAAYVNDRINVL
jgi:hypothetical protein